MSKIPEYTAIDKLYHDEEKRIEGDKEKCKDEVFELMKKYFFASWN